MLRSLFPYECKIQLHLVLVRFHTKFFKVLQMLAAKKKKQIERGAQAVGDCRMCNESGTRVCYFLCLRCFFHIELTLAQMTATLLHSNYMKYQSLLFLTRFV